MDVLCCSPTTFPQRGQCLWTLFVSILLFSCGHCMFLLCISHLFTTDCVLCGGLYFEEAFHLKIPPWPMSHLESLTLLVPFFTLCAWQSHFIDLLIYLFIECHINYCFERKVLTFQDTVTTKHYHPWNKKLVVVGFYHFSFFDKILWHPKLPESTYSKGVFVSGAMGADQRTSNPLVNYRAIV